MIKEFEENVKKLLHTITTKQDTQKHTAAELLDLLKCKVTLPVKTTWEDDSLKMVYYNVSLDIKNDLSSMTISYNKDYMVDFRQLTRCDLHQLADFILALERDIPRWKHVWVAEVEPIGIFKNVPFLKNIPIALGSIIVPTIWQYVGYHMLLMYAGVKGVSTDYR